MSNQAIEQAAFKQNPLLAELSVAAYALSKLLIKPHVSESSEWKELKKNVLSRLDQPENLASAVNSIITDTSAFDKSMGNYVIDVIEKARLKQGARADALGLAPGAAAELTRANKVELFSYVGATRIHERPFTQTMDVAKRYKNARAILKGDKA